MDALPNSRWHDRKERPKRSTNKGDMDEKAKRPMDEEMMEWDFDIYVVIEKLSF